MSTHQVKTLASYPQPLYCAQRWSVLISEWMRISQKRQATAFDFSLPQVYLFFQFSRPEEGLQKSSCHCSFKLRGGIEGFLPLGQLPLEVYQSHMANREKTPPPHGPPLLAQIQVWLGGGGEAGITVCLAAALAMARSWSKMPGGGRRSRQYGLRGERREGWNQKQMKSWDMTNG